MKGLDIKRIYAQARGFQLAAERCMEDRQDFERVNLPIQAIVCYSFACEIYLKAIYVYENPYSERVVGHSLEQLFSKISSKRKDTILSILSSLYSREISLNLISDCSKLFEEFRYIYETYSNNYPHVGFVYSFSEALRTVVEELVVSSVMNMCTPEG